MGEISVLNLIPFRLPMLRQMLEKADDEFESLIELYPRIFAWFFVCFICGGLATVYGADGHRKLSGIILYLGLLVSTQLSVHWVLKDLNFPNPIFLTFLQYLLLSIFSISMFWKRITRIRNADGTIFKLRSTRFLSFYTRKILPVVLTLAVGVSLNNTSLGVISPGFNAVLGQLTPVLTAIFSSFLGTRFSRRAWMAIIFAVLGGLCAMRGGMSAETKLHRGEAWFGVFLSLSSMICRSLKNVLMERNMNGSGSNSEVGGVFREPDPILNPGEMIVLQTPLVALVLLVMSCFTKAGVRGPIHQILYSDHSGFIAFGVFVNATSASLLNFAGMYILRSIGATSMQLVGKCNTFVVLAFSAAYFGEIVSLAEVAGAGIVLWALWLFATTQKKKKQKPQKRNPEFSDSDRGQDP